MSIKSRTFEWAGRGWKPTDSPEFYPGAGLLVTHDTLEHYGTSTEFKNELVAFGITMFGRMTMRTNHQLRSSSIDLANFLAEEHYKVPAPSPYAAKLRLDAQAEFLLTRFMSDTAHASHSPHPDYRSDKLISRDHFLEKEEEIKAWIRLGYKIAKRLYKTSENLWRLFKDLQNEVEMDHDFNTPKNGSMLRIDINLNKNTFNLYRYQKDKELQYA